MTAVDVAHEPRLCLFGASADTGNLGVSALMTATVLGLVQRAPRARITVFDHGLGRRRGRIDAGSTPAAEFELLGARMGRRYHRPENLTTMRWAAQLGGLGNRGVRAITNADAVLDISGGDSFTDLYGPRRFEQIVASKHLALRSGSQLILLPQTYGPFDNDASRLTAAKILRGAALVYARGTDSFELIQELLGSDFDPRRHRQGVDMALVMPPVAPPNKTVHDFRAFRGRDDRPLVGLNISGLLFGNSTTAYGLSVEYDTAVTELVRRLISHSEARVVLVPHVSGDSESDTAACHRLARAINQPSRVLVGPDQLNAQQTKWLISQTDWFCGTRMHATIAALSSGTPTAAIAYSHKTREVFAAFGLQNQVADARTLSTTQLIDRLWASWTQRDDVRQTLEATMPQVLASAQQQLDDIVEMAGHTRRPALTRRRL